MPGQSLKTAAVVLAAGRSDRMGYPKSLLIFGKETAVDRVVRICREGGCDPVIVVLGHEADRVLANAVLQGVETVTNEAYETGRTSSLQTGLRGLPPDTSAILLFPVDHPMVDPSTVAALLAAAGSGPHRIVVPVHGGRRGHPVLFDARLIPEFTALGPDTPASTITAADPSRVVEVTVEDAGVLMDVDTSRDYITSLELYTERGGEAGFLAPKGAAGRPAPKKPPV